MANSADDSASISRALDYPEARALAFADATKDRISLRDHIVSTEIGAFQQERGQRQRLRFNLVVDLPDAGPAADDVDAILSYDTLIEAIDSALADERLNLLETLAERIAARILRAPQARQVILRIEKLDRASGALGVEILRRKPAAPKGTQQPRPLDWARPERVVYLPPEALSHPTLGHQISRWARETPGMILCVGIGAEAAGLPARQADAQRHIDLLAAAQAAWRLSDRLATQGLATTVTGTRTELDWALKQGALKQGTLAIWSPVKMGLDAMGPPAPSPRDGVALALWFARAMQAGRLAVVGDMLPDVTDFTCERLELAQTPARRPCKTPSDP